MIRGNGMSRVKHAVGWWRVSGIATWNRRRLSAGIELRQAVKRLVGIAVQRPVFSQRAKVVIERAILLCQENNMVDRGNVLSIECAAYLLVSIHRHVASGVVSVTGSAPSHEIRVLRSLG